MPALLPGHLLTLWDEASQNSFPASPVSPRMKHVSTSERVVKKQETLAQATVAHKPKLEPPALQRLGTLRELTRMFNGMGMDGGMANMSFP